MQYLIQDWPIFYQNSPKYLLRYDNDIEHLEQLVLKYTWNISNNSLDTFNQLFEINSTLSKFKDSTLR